MIFKSLICVILATSFNCYGKLGPEWMANATISSESTRSNPTKENILKLGEELIGIDNYNSGSAEELKVINTISETLISIPQVAQYFVDELERERSSLKPGEYSGKFNNKRFDYIVNILGHLPSPETITVLGKYLYDDRDLPPPRSPGDEADSDRNPPSSFLAYRAIMGIGLRNPPITEKSFWAKKANRDEFALSRTRGWFTEVQAGREAFSFVGQKVEYRFKPDGTWDTTALLEPPNEPIIKPGEPDPSTAVLVWQTWRKGGKLFPDRYYYLYSLCGGLVLLIVAGVWWRLRRSVAKRRKTHDLEL